MWRMSESITKHDLEALSQALEQNDADAFKLLAEEIHYADLADFYEELDEVDRAKFAEFAGTKVFAEVVADIPDILVEDAIEHFSPADQHELLDELTDDDLADALQDVSEDAKARYMSLLDPKDKKVVDALLKYGEETAGGRMTTHYGRVHLSMTVKEALESLRGIEEETDSLARIFVSDDEVHRIVADWKSRSEPDYLEEVLTGGDGEPFLQLDSNSDTEQEDVLYDEAVEFVLESRRASISSVQRKLRIGYNRAARLIEAMEMAGLVSPMGSNGSRELLVPKRD